MVNWNCCSALCTNNHRTVLPDGSKVKYYRLPRDKSIQQQYTTILKTTGINFKNGHTCSQHWKKGFRESTADLPDICVPLTQLSKLKAHVNTPASKTKATKKTKDTLKRNLSAAERVHGELSDSPSSFTPPSSKKRKSPKKKELFHLQSGKTRCVQGS